jgi:hypothetical protein
MPASGFQRTETGDHFIPRLDGFGDCGGLVLARHRNCGTELPADGTDHSQDDFVTPIPGAARAATHIGFGATGAISLSHNSEQVPCERTSWKVYETGSIQWNRSVALTVERQ